MSAPKPESKIVPRPINEIAHEIVKLWRTPEGRPSENVLNYAIPYLQGMATMNRVEDMYGLEYGDMVIAYFLANVTNWRGPDARRIKAELKQAIKDFNERRH